MAAASLTMKKSVVSQFDFPKEQYDDLKQSLQSYAENELEIKMGDLQVELFMQFLHEKIGNHYYNLGIREAIKQIKDKADDLFLLLKED